MKTTALLLAFALAVLASSSASAADDCAPVVSTPVCADPALAGAGSVAVGRTVTVPGPANTTVTYGVPVPGPGQRVEWVEETYTDTELRLETVREEPRTRTVSKPFNVVHTKTVRDAHIVKVPSRSRRATRLVRGKIDRQKEYTRREMLRVQEDYMHPIQEPVAHEVTRVRRVPALVKDPNVLVCD